MRNVTAIATGANSVGIQSRYNDSSAGSHTLTLTNSIAHGASDLRTEDGNGPGRIVASHSNFDLVKAESPGAISGAGNQSAQPVFLAPGDYREAPGSPTIDAGVAEGIGLLDLAGNPRLLGSAPDIGAFEFVPTAATRCGGAHLALGLAEVLPAAKRRRCDRQQVAACKEGWSHGWLRPHRRGTGEIQGRAGAARAGRRRQVRQADRGQPGQEEVHSVQGPEGGLRRPGRRRREQLQILGTGRPQGAEAGAVPAVASAGTSLRRTRFTIKR